MNIKALPSMGQRLFCCFCFVESAVCSTFAERIIRGCLGGDFRGCLQGVHLSQVHQQSKKYTPKLHQQNKKCTNRARSTPLNCTNRARSAPTELRWCT